MNLSTFDNYRELIKSLFKAEGLSYRQVCQKTNIHSSYFSRVMSEKADFSQEQIYLIGKVCKLSGWELDFLLLLVERDSSSLKIHSQYIDKKIKAIRNEKQKVQKSESSIDGPKPEAPPAGLGIPTALFFRVSTSRSA